MIDQYLINELAKYPTFGISLVQKIKGYGYNNAARLIDELQQQGTIEPTHLCDQWRVVMQKRCNMCGQFVRKHRWIPFVLNSQRRPVCYDCSE